MEYQKICQKECQKIAPLLDPGLMYVPPINRSLKGPSTPWTGHQSTKAHSRAPQIVKPNGSFFVQLTHTHVCW